MFRMLIDDRFVKPSGDAFIWPIPAPPFDRDCQAPGLIYAQGQGRASPPDRGAPFRNTISGYSSAKQLEFLAKASLGVRVRSSSSN